MNKIENVVFVDDDSISGYINRLVLEEMEVAENLLWLQDGQEALAYVAKQCAVVNPEAKTCRDLIFLDLNMPQVNGFEFLEQVQTLPGVDLLGLYIVMLSSSWHSRDIEKAHTYQIKDYLIKPLTAEKVTEVVKKYHHHVNTLG